MRKRNLVIKNCIGCSKLFASKGWRKQKYCLHGCFLNSNPHISKNTEIKKGQRLSRKTEFKKGLIPWNDGIPWSKEMKQKLSGSIKITAKRGSENHSWKGDNVGYSGLHYWVKRQLGNPSYCEHCRKIEGKFNWANKSHEYKRELDDWIRLCMSCHAKYDETSKDRERDYKGRFI